MKRMDQMRWPFYMYRADFERIGEHTKAINEKNKRTRIHTETRTE